MLRSHTYVLTLATMIAFAGNSLLCRQALKNTSLDAGSFTLIRVLSGALALWLMATARRSGGSVSGSWRSALALFGYAAGFSYAYISLPAGMGALLLFGAVQATMIGYGLAVGERLRLWQTVGLLLSLGGLVWLLLPGVSAPPVVGSVLMLGAGFAWGIYSLLGRGIADPLGATAGNFLRAVPLAIVLAAVALPWSSLDGWGVGYAVLSGALTSGIGYAIWYTALRNLTATTAAIVQLSVPVIAAAGGIAFLGEQATVRLLVSSMAILGGIAMVVLCKRRER